MAVEQFANVAASTLVGSITSGATSITVASAATFPAGPNFRVTIDNEILLVTAVAGAVFTVSRGQEGTVAAGHANAAAVTHYLTVGSLNQHHADRVLRDLFANRPAAGVAGRLFLASDNPYESYDDGSAWHTKAYGNLIVEPPDMTTWTWVNQGASTVTRNGNVVLHAVETGGPIARMLLIAAPSTPYTFTFGLIVTMKGAGSNYPGGGFVFRDSVSLKQVNFGVQSRNNTLVAINVTYWANSTSPTTDLGNNPPILPYAGIVWCRCGDDGTHRTYQISCDGYNWLLIFQENSNNNFTANQVGVYTSCDTDPSDTYTNILSWLQS